MSTPAVISPVIEILYFGGCPHYESARELVASVVDELGIDADIRLVDVPSPDDAISLGFLGSPSIRVNGSDVEPGADQRTDFGFSCRVFRTATGLGPTPDRAWIQNALRSGNASTR